jgi:16S rRNA G966 N2-methylase RsmD
MPKQPPDRASARLKPSALVDRRVIYCGDNVEQPRKLPDGCVDLVYIDPPFNSNRNYEVLADYMDSFEAMMTRAVARKASSCRSRIRLTR